MSDSKRTRTLGDLVIAQVEERDGETCYYPVGNEVFATAADARRHLKDCRRPGDYRLVRLVGPVIRVEQKMNPQYVLTELALHDDSGLGDVGHGEAFDE